jgi:hypothetical protein
LPAGHDFEQAIKNEVQEPFDLTNGPLFRAKLFVFDNNTNVLLLLFHHIIIDGWSIDIMLQDLNQIYSALINNKLISSDGVKLHYIDYALWQRTIFPIEIINQHREYWQTLLAGAPEQIKLPYDFNRPQMLGCIGSTVKVNVSKLLINQITLRHNLHGITNFNVFLANFVALLYAYSEEQDMVIGTSIANRCYEGTENILGLVMHNMALRMSFSKNISFQNLLSQVVKLVQISQSHSAIPYEQLVHDLNIPIKQNQHPLFQVMFSYRLINEDTIFEPFDSFVGNNIIRYDLRLRVYEYRDHFAISFEYADELFKKATIEKLAEHFVAMLNDCLIAPELSITQQPVYQQIHKQQVFYAT